MSLPSPILPDQPRQHLILDVAKHDLSNIGLLSTGRIAVGNGDAIYIMLADTSSPEQIAKKCFVASAKETQGANSFYQLVNPTPYKFETGLLLFIKPNHDNNASPYLSLNDFEYFEIRRSASSLCPAGELKQDQIYGVLAVGLDPLNPYFQLVPFDYNYTPDLASLDADAFADYGLTKKSIADGSLTGDKIVPNSIDGTKIKDRALTAIKFKLSTLTNDEVNDLTLENPKFATHSIERTAIQEISGSSIEDRSLSLAIAPQTFTSDTIADSAITEDKFKPNSIDGAALGVNVITSEKLGVLTNECFASGAVPGFFFLTSIDPLVGSIPVSKILAETLVLSDFDTFIQSIVHAYVEHPLRLFSTIDSTVKGTIDIGAGTFDLSCKDCNQSLTPDYRQPIFRSTLPVTPPTPSNPTCLSIAAAKVPTVQTSVNPAVTTDPDCAYFNSQGYTQNSFFFLTIEDLNVLRGCGFGQHCRSVDHFYKDCLNKYYPASIGPADQTPGSIMICENDQSSTSLEDIIDRYGAGTASISGASVMATPLSLSTKNILAKDMFIGAYVITESEIDMRVVRAFAQLRCKVDVYKHDTLYYVFINEFEQTYQIIKQVPNGFEATDSFVGEKVARLYFGNVAYMLASNLPNIDIFSLKDRYEQSSAYYPCLFQFEPYLEALRSHARKLLSSATAQKYLDFYLN